MERIDHGTMFYKAVKSGIVDPATSVQVGIRTTNEDTMGVNIIDAREVHENGPQATVSKIKSILGDRPCYLTSTSTRWTRPLHRAPARRSGAG